MTNLGLPLVLASVIGGKVVDHGERWPVVDPATAEPFAELRLGDEATIAEAVASSTQAVPAWATMDAAARGRILRNVAEAIRSNSEVLTHVETLDTGKPLSQAASDVALAARYFEFYASAIEAFGGQTIRQAGGLAFTEMEPLGVTGHIVPWNYPIQIMCRSIAPSIAAGNAVVVKPAEDACLTPLLMATLAHDAGLPPGVLNVVPGLGPVAGEALARHPDVEHLAFTGSVHIGRHVAAVAAKRGRPSILELGGKGAHLVLESADLDRCMPVVFKTLLQNGGQTCSAGTRLVIHESLVSDTEKWLVRLMDSTRIGAGVSDPDLGPLISDKQRQRVQGYVDRALENGARRIAVKDPDTELKGFFTSPIVIGDVSPDDEIAQDEIFGPVLTLLPFATETEGLQIVNGTRYGLTSGVWSESADVALRTANLVDAGQVYVNGFVAGGGVELPFGGFKDSGFGREKGAQALLAYTQSKTTIISVAN